MKLKINTTIPAIHFVDWISPRRKINEQPCNPYCICESVVEHKHKVLDIFKWALLRGNIFPKRCHSLLWPTWGKSREEEENGGRSPIWCSQRGDGGQQVSRQDVDLQSFNEPGNSLVNVCQRSIFLSLFLRQSNQCLSLSPFALIPRDTPPERRRRESVSHTLERVGDLQCVTL